MKLSKQIHMELYAYHKIYLKHQNQVPLNQQELQSIIPVRDDFVAAYRYLCKFCQDPQSKLQMMALCRNISWHSKREMNLAKTMICLEVMAENKLIDLQTDQDYLTITIHKDAPQINLADSKILKSLKAAYQNENN